jgi:hypothetical protein
VIWFSSASARRSLLGKNEDTRFRDSNIFFELPRGLSLWRRYGCICYRLEYSDIDTFSFRFSDALLSLRRLDLRNSFLADDLLAQMVDSIVPLLAAVAT